MCCLSPQGERLGEPIDEIQPVRVAPLMFPEGSESEMFLDCLCTGLLLRCLRRHGDTRFGMMESVEVLEELPEVRDC